MIHINIFAMEDMDDSIVDVSPPVIDIIDLTKESPRSGRSSRSHQRRAEDESSSHSVTENLNRHFRRPLSPIVLGNTPDSHQTRSPVRERRERRVSRATSSNEVLTLDNTIEKNSGTFYTVESDNKELVPLTCPICFESLSSSLKPITTRCGHLFCTECLETFIRTSKKCPTCKAGITLKTCTRVYL